MIEPQKHMVAGNYLLLSALLFIFLLLCDACAHMPKQANHGDMVGASEIRKQLETAFPNAEIKMTMRLFFYRPTVDELKWMVEAKRVTKLSKESNCVNYSCALNGRIKEAVAQWAFGEAEIGLHHINICLTTNGAYLIDSQLNKIWKTSQDKDVWWIRI